MRVVYMFWSISQLESKRHMSNYSSLSNSALVSVADPVNNVWWWWWSRLIFNISPNLWHLSELYISMNEQMLGQKEEGFFWMRTIWWVWKSVCSSCHSSWLLSQKMPSREIYWLLFDHKDTDCKNSPASRKSCSVVLSKCSLLIILELKKPYTL